MKEIKLTKDNKVTVLQTAIEILNKGGIIVYPTETSYGLGCDFYNGKACNRVYKIKGRDKKKSLSVIVPDIVAASYLIDFSENSRRLALQYWPGPLTLILPYKYCKLKHHCDDYLALRVSNNPFASDLAANFGKPLVATSANVSNGVPSYTPEDVKRQFKDLKIKPDLFINAGNLPEKKNSTIIKFIKDKGEIIRQGDIKIKLPLVN